MLSILLFALLKTSLAGFEDETFNGVKFLKSHSFPVWTDEGEQTANEFQMVYPERMTIKMDSAYSITSVSPLIISNDEMVTVNFKTTATPDAGDFIAAYSPANVDITTTIPVKYGYCDDSDGYNATGSGFLQFNMTNLRADVAFYFFIG